MPEYLAPGVFVEETSFRQKTIEGASTSTTGFVGPCRFGPVSGEPELLTSFADFERIYGGIDHLEFDNISDPAHNYTAHGVRAYFEEGGRRLYVARVYNPPASGDGIARWTTAGSPAHFTLAARHPGNAGEFTVTFVFRLGDNVLKNDSDGSESIPDPANNLLRGVREFDVVLAGNLASIAGDDEALYWVQNYFDTAANATRQRLVAADGTHTALSSISQARVLTVSVLVGPLGRFGFEQSWEDLSIHPEHRNSLSNVFNSLRADRRTELFVPLVFNTEQTNGAALADALLANSSIAGGSASPASTVADALTLLDPEPLEAARSFRVVLENGSDGNQPLVSDYTGSEGTVDGIKSGLRSFEDVEDISIVAAPGSSFDYSGLSGANYAEAIARRVISHCEKMRYRIAVLDSINGDILGQVRDYRSIFDSTRASLYYPWIKTFDPLTEQFIHVPPSGSICGIYARNDVERGVHKAPANEPVRMASGLEFVLNMAEQETLNPKGINCLRFFEGRGIRIWGARTVTSDPEWKYVNVRRYFAFLERSIEVGTQWAVFENNGPVLWENVARTIEDFLYNEWQQNHLLGATPDQAYFVRCDRSTMTQNDLDNGRLVCVIGVAPLRPAEFVIFRIGQKTADS